MLITIDSNSCVGFGGTRASKASESELQSGAVYCLGDIVHDGQEVARLEQMGL